MAKKKKKKTDFVFFTQKRAWLVFKIGAKYYMRNEKFNAAANLCTVVVPKFDLPSFDSFKVCYLTSNVNKFLFVLRFGQGMGKIITKGK